MSFKGPAAMTLTLAVASLGLGCGSTSSTVSEPAKTYTRSPTLLRSEAPDRLLIVFTLANGERLTSLNLTASGRVRGIIQRARGNGGTISDLAFETTCVRISKPGARQVRTEGPKGEEGRLYAKSFEEARCRSMSLTEK